jgi:hypothetical protein
MTNGRRFRLLITQRPIALAVLREAKMNFALMLDGARSVAQWPQQSPQTSMRILRRRDQGASLPKATNSEPAAPWAQSIAQLQATKEAFACPRLSSLADPRLHLSLIVQHPRGRTPEDIERPATRKGDDHPASNPVIRQSTLPEDRRCYAATHADNLTARRMQESYRPQGPAVAVLRSGSVLLFRVAKRS